MNHFLVGFMGSGKTTLGKTAAAQLGWQFSDLDDEVERWAERPISVLFAEKGEDVFRRMEAEALRRLPPPNGPRIVATGGGTPCFHENLPWMQKHGRVYYLRVSVEELDRRLAATAEQRPLLASLSDEARRRKIADLLKKREPWYERADFSIPADNLSVAALVKLLTLPARLRNRR